MSDNYIRNLKYGDKKHAITVTCQYSNDQTAIDIDPYTVTLKIVDKNDLLVKTVVGSVLDGDNGQAYFEIDEIDFGPGIYYGYVILTQGTSEIHTLVDDCQGKMFQINILQAISTS